MIRRLALGAALVGTVLAGAAPARAGLTAARLAEVGLAPPAGAAVPGDLGFDETGRPATTLGAILGRRPAVLVLADYRCREICGPILSLVGSALAGTGLRPGLDFDLVVVGLDPRATSAEARAMAEAQLGDWPDLARAARVLVGGPGAIAALKAAIGYRAAFDPEADRFAHPSDVLILAPDGGVARVLPGLALDGEAVRLALVQAGQGRIGDLGDRLHLLCYGLAPATGILSGTVRGLLVGGGVLTVAGLGLFVRRLRPQASLAAKGRPP